MLPGCFFTLLVSTLWLCSMLPVLASLPPSLPGETSVSCTDDSDCTPLGHKFGCFLYRCLNFLDSPLPRCVPGGAGGCLATETCHRHHLLRGEGLCFPSSQLEPCSSSPNNCSSSQLPECCGDWCCPQSYHSQWSSKMCFTHQECRTWGTGHFCCDGDCCAELPEEEEYYDYDGYLSTTEEDYLGTTQKDYMDTTGEGYQGTVLPDPQESFSTIYEEEGESSTNSRVQEREEGASADNSSLGGTHASGDDDNSRYTTISNLSEDSYDLENKLEVELESTIQEDGRMETTSSALEVLPPTLTTLTTNHAVTFGHGESVNNTSYMTPVPMPSDTKSLVKEVLMVKEEAIWENIEHEVDAIGNSSSLFKVKDNVWTMTREENHKEEKDVMIKIAKNSEEAAIDSHESAGLWPSSPVAGWPHDMTAHREDRGQMELFLSLGATEEEGLELLEEEHDYDEEEGVYPEEETADEKDSDVELTGHVFTAFTTSDPELVHDMTRNPKIGAEIASNFKIAADMTSDTLMVADIASQSGVKADLPSDPVTAADMASNRVIPATRPFFPHSSAIPDMRAGGGGLGFNTLLLSVLLIHLLCGP